MRIGYLGVLTVVVLSVLFAPTGRLLAQPCQNSPDINGDGSVDACDLLLFAHDLGTSNLRSDFDCNGQVNLNDLSLFSQSLCYTDPSPPPPPPASAGTATIGVYFDAAGTITSQSNVPAFTLLDFYVVAHGVPQDMERYLFRLAVSGGLTGPPSVDNVDWPAGTTGTVDPSITGNDNYLVGFEGSCLSPTGGTVLLAHFTDFYLGGANSTYEVLAPDLTGASCMAPADEPSYGPCGSGCGWTYFAPDSNRVAVVNPAVPDPCVAFELQLNTGYDHVGEAVYPVGAIDGFYSVLYDPDANTTEPRQANVISKHAAWQLPQADSQWISNYPGSQNLLNGPYIFSTCFCLEDGFTDALLHVGCRADDQVSVYLNETIADILNNVAVPIHVGQDFNDPALTFTDFTNQGRFQPGENCILFRVDNTGSVAMGLNAVVNVSASGGGLTKTVCCDTTGGLQGQKWNDLNGDGVRQGGEPAMAGWTINLSTGASAVTDVFGWYYFNDLAPGTYVVTEANQAGWQQTAPAGGSYSVTLDIREYVGNLDFGNHEDPCVAFELQLNTGYDHVGEAVYPVGAIDGFYSVLYDPDANTTEPRQANVISKHAAWQLPQADSQWISNYPGSQNLLNGPYIFSTCFCLEDGFTDALLHVGCRADDQVSVYLNETIADILNNVAVPIHVGQDFNDPALTFTDFTNQGRFQPGENCILFRVDNTGSVAMGLNAVVNVSASGGGLTKTVCCDTTGGLQGQKWNDLNGDGVRQGGEPAMAGWTINLSTGASAVTDVFGWYYFNDLAPGTYVVTEANQAGWQQTAPAGGSYSVTLDTREYVGNLDFGNHRARVGVNKDLKNNTGQIANDIEILLEGAYAEADIQHYDGAGSYLFTSFTVTPDPGGNTRLHWQYPGSDVAVGDIAHVGFQVPGSLAKILGVFWTRDGVVTGCARQCRTGTHLLGTPGGQVVYKNNCDACESASLYVGDLTVEWHAGEVPLADLVANAVRTPLRTDVVSHAPLLIAPGDSATVAIPEAPAGATYAVIVHKVSADPALSGPDVTTDFLEFEIQQDGVSGIDDSIEPGSRSTGFSFQIRRNPLRFGDIEVQFELPAADQVSVDVYDLRGRRIRSQGPVSLAAGQQIMLLDPRDDGGRRLPSGVYLVRLTFQSIGISQTRSVTIIE